MAMDDKKFEEYLSEFRSREPRAMTASDAGFWQRWGARAGDCGSFSADCGGNIDLDETACANAHFRASFAAGTISCDTASERDARHCERSVTRAIGDAVQPGPGSNWMRLWQRLRRNLLPHVDRPDSTLHSLDHD